MAKVQSEVSARSYIATEAFNTDFFTYKITKVNFNTVGTLTLVTSNASLCPAGRVLRENGRKLAPGMNPGVPTYMVGVYDNQSGLSGFIDPNAPVFAVYNNNRPNFLVDNVDLPPGGLTDQGQPVLTNGLVSALQSVSAGTTVTAGTSITAGTTVTARKFLTSPVGSGHGTSSAPLQSSSGSASFNTTTGAPNNYGHAIVYTTQVTSTSLIFITVNNEGPRSVTAVPRNGEIHVYSSVPNDASTFYWLVIN